MFTEIIEPESIDEIFCSPKDYVDESYDRPLIKIHTEIGMGPFTFTILIGIDDDGTVYLVAEDDEVAEDFYPDPGETLWDVYKRIIKDWVQDWVQE